MTIIEQINLDAFEVRYEFAGQILSYSLKKVRAVVEVIPPEAVEIDIGDSVSQYRNVQVLISEAVGISYNTVLYGSDGRSYTVLKMTKNDVTYDLTCRMN